MNASRFKITSISDVVSIVALAYTAVRTAEAVVSLAKEVRRWNDGTVRIKVL